MSNQSSDRPSDKPDAFWKTKTLEEMTHSEWESLCDGCARCCQLCLEDEDTGEVVETGVVCRYLDRESGRCGEYGKRSELVPTCMTLTPDNLGDAYFAPQHCAYRRLLEGRDLPTWHPLITGSRRAMEAEGVAVTPEYVSEEIVQPDDLVKFIISETYKP